LHLDLGDSDQANDVVEMGSYPLVTRRIIGIPHECRFVCRTAGRLWPRTIMRSTQHRLTACQRVIKLGFGIFAQSAAASRRCAAYRRA